MTSELLRGSGVGKWVGGGWVSVWEVCKCVGGGG